MTVSDVFTHPAFTFTTFLLVVVAISFCIRNYLDSKRAERSYKDLSNHALLRDDIATPAKKDDSDDEEGEEDDSDDEEVEKVQKPPTRLHWGERYHEHIKTRGSEGYNKHTNMALHGHNREKLYCGGRGWSSCQKYCKEECDKRDWCKSFDYRLRQGSGKRKFCWLQDEDRNSKPNDWKESDNYHYFDPYREKNGQRTYPRGHCFKPGDPCKGR